MGQIQISRNKISERWQNLKETTRKILCPILQYRFRKSKHHISTTAQDAQTRDIINVLDQNCSILPCLQETLQTHIDHLKYIMVTRKSSRGVFSAPETEDRDNDILEAARMMQKVTTVALLATNALYVGFGSGDSVVEVVNRIPVEILDRLEDVVMEIEDIIGDWE